MVLLAKAVALDEKGEMVTVTFECPVCGATFEVTGVKYDPPPPPDWTCPFCKVLVRITPDSA